MFENITNQDQIHVHWILSYLTLVTTLEKKRSYFYQEFSRKVGNAFKKKRDLMVWKDTAFPIFLKSVSNSMARLRLDSPSNPKNGCIEWKNVTETSLISKLSWQMNGTNNQMHSSSSWWCHQQQYHRKYWEN